MGQVFSVRFWPLKILLLKVRGSQNLPHKPAVVVKQFKALCDISQLIYGMPLVPGLNPTGDYDIDCSELEITCCYSKSRALDDLWSLTKLLPITFHSGLKE